MTTHDVTILGGGLAGLTLAKQLKTQRPEIRILILERNEFPVPEGAFKVGESTIEVGAHYLAEQVGLKKHLVEHHLPKFGLRFFFTGGAESLSDAVEVGLSDFFPTPGYQIDRGRLENHLVETLSESGVAIAQGATVKDVSLNGGDEVHAVEYEQEGECRRAESRWIVDASGRAGLLKRKLGLREEVSHRVNAAWFRLGAEICVDCWSDDPAWKARTGKVARRWLSTNHLLGRGYWLWIIPLSCGSTSIGIVADPRLHPLSEFNQYDKALEWIERHEPTCAAAILPHRDGMQDFKAIKHLAHGCREVYSADRWAITGEAGVFLDPLYSPGIDYIAMANRQIGSLVDRDLGGEAINLLAPRYQGLFLQLFRDNLRTYEDQYPLFGNPRVMSLKYVWDYALYWSFPALLYFNDKLTDPPFFAKAGESIETIRELNKRMQRFFREWDAADPDYERSSSFINQNEIAILSQLNGELRNRLDDEALTARIERNVGILEELASEITTRSGTGPSAASKHPPNGSAPAGRLGEVFDALGM
ncbi:MAG: tryptophan 7-halogenase [Verrucomicrobiales bacterium]